MIVVHNLNMSSVRQNVTIVMGLPCLVQSNEHERNLDDAVLMRRLPSIVAGGSG
jgi:hypothetical protein